MEPYEIIMAPYEIFLAPVGESFPDVDETPAGNWAKLGTNGKYNLAGSIMGQGVYDHYSVLTRILGHTDEESNEIIQKLENQLLRQQELQTQAQVFAQLAMPGMDGEAQAVPGALPSPEPGMESGALPAPDGAAQALPAPDAMMALPAPAASAPAQEKPKRFKDFEDLEADEEEVDRDYES